MPASSLYLAGAGEKIGPRHEAIPNITLDKQTGIGEWKLDDLVELLHSGVKPDLDNVQGLMDEVLHGTLHGNKDITRKNVLAIADCLKFIPPIKNRIN